MKIFTMFKAMLVVCLFCVGSSAWADFSPSFTGYFAKITNASDIVDGGQYIIVREDTETQYAAGINECTAKYLSVNEFSTTGYYYGEVNASGKPYVYTLTAHAENDGYYFLTNGDKYLNAASSGTDLMLGDKSDYSNWSIEFTNKKNVNITNKSALSGSSSRLIKYSSTGNPARFAAYTSGSVVTLYRYVPSVAVSSAGYATYYNEYPYVMPTGLEGKIMEEDTKTDKIVANTPFQAGVVVPANTALLLKGAEGVYPLPITTTAPDEELVEYVESNNLLKGRLTAGMTEGDGLHYKFTRDDDGLGWYWGAADGAAFNISANKAYLVVPDNLAQSARFISIDDAETAINSINADVKNNSIYDLAGRRINGTTKGMYIVNGKKVIF